MSKQYSLYTGQYDFVNDPARYTAFIGGVGSGKTYAGAVKAILTCLENPSWKRGLIVAPTYTMLMDATFITCLEVWGDLVADYTKTPYPNVKLITGQEIWFRSADNPERLRGPNLWWAWIDEGAYCNKNVYTRLIARLRAGGLAGPLWITTTPNQLNWVSELVASSIFSAHHSPTQANPYVSEEYVRDLYAQYPDELARQELGGEFIEFGAGIIRTSWFDYASAANYARMSGWNRYWDLAVSTKTSSDYTASVRALHMDDVTLLDSPMLFRAEWPDTRAVILRTEMEERGETDAVGVESNAFQLAALQDLARTDNFKQNTMLMAVRSDKDKLSRALPWIGQARLGNIVLLVRPGRTWTPWLEQIAAFPAGAHDDAVDATSGAWEMKNQIKRPARVRVRSGGKAV